MTPAQLKTSILLNAIQGKLVEQIDTELCCDIKSTYQGEAFDLFDIPVNWKWVAIKDVATINTGLAFKKQDQKTSVDGTLRILRGGNIGDDYKYHLYDNDIYVDLSQFKDKYIPLQIGDVITPSVTSMEKMCKTGFIDVELENTTAGGFVYIIRSNNPSILDSKYLLYFISSSFNKEQCKPNIHKSGQAFYNLKKSGFVEQPICLPPIEEQHRIVSKIEELLTYVDRYAEAYEKLEQFNAKFPEDMKKSILQYAIQGKLVEQRPEEGTAEELYQQIQDEKQKIEKKSRKSVTKDVFPEEEILFDIPETWKWVHLKDIMSVYGGKRIPAGKKLTKENTGHIYIRVSDMKDGSVMDTDIHYVPEDIHPLIKNYTISKDDVYITVAGTIGRVGIIPERFDNANLTENADKLIIYSLNKEYVMYLMSSPIIQRQIIEATTKVGQPKLAIKRIEDMVIPLPPLAEQERIASRVNEILPICERLVK